MKTRAFLALAAALVLFAPAAARENWIDKLLRVTGLTAAPSQMRGQALEVEVGDVWLARIDQDAVKRLTTEARYRSPVFSVSGDRIYAMRDDQLVVMSADGGRPGNMFAVSGVAKLLGFDGLDADQLVCCWTATMRRSASCRSRAGNSRGYLTTALWRTAATCLRKRAGRNVFTGRTACMSPQRASAKAHGPRIEWRSTSNAATSKPDKWMHASPPVARNRRCLETESASFTSNVAR